MDPKYLFKTAMIVAVRIVLEPCLGPTLGMEVWNEFPCRSARPHVLMLIFSPFLDNNTVLYILQSSTQCVFPSLGDHLRELLSAQSQSIPRICFISVDSLSLFCFDDTHPHSTYLSYYVITCEEEARHLASLTSHRLRPWLQSSRVNSSLSMYQAFTDSQEQQSSR
jgi:hypothetical protein